MNSAPSPQRAWPAYTVERKPMAWRDVAFTPSVKAVQSRKGSRASYGRMEEKGGWQTRISLRRHDSGLTNAGDSQMSSRRRIPDPILQPIKTNQPKPTGNESAFANPKRRCRTVAVECVASPGGF